MVINPLTYPYLSNAGLNCAIIVSEHYILLSIMDLGFIFNRDTIYTLKNSISYFSILPVFN